MTDSVSVSDHEARLHTFSSLLLVRKSVEGFRMVVMALASSSWSVLLLLTFISAFNTYWTHNKCPVTQWQPFVLSWNRTSCSPSHMNANNAPDLLHDTEPRYESSLWKDETRRQTECTSHNNIRWTSAEHKPGDINSNIILTGDDEHTKQLIQNGGKKLHHHMSLHSMKTLKREREHMKWRVIQCCVMTEVIFRQTLRYLISSPPDWPVASTLWQWWKKLCRCWSWEERIRSICIDVIHVM